jgi:FkbM family methyltransferase
MFGPIKRALKRRINAAGYTLVRSPTSDLRLSVGGALVGVNPPVAIDLESATPSNNPNSATDYFAKVDGLLNLITPWSGEVPQGYIVDFLGILRDGSFLWKPTNSLDAHHESTTLPTVGSHGEAWFEIASWLMSAHEAQGQYVAVSLGAAFGHQLVGAWKALQAINPLPSRLVAVEPVPQHCEWLRRHMATNGINPADHWIIQAALGHDNEPVLFPVGAAGTGLNNSQSTNLAESRRACATLVRDLGQSEQVVENILMYNSTGIVRDLGFGCAGELKLISAVTLRDVLSPLDRVDLLEVDIQQSEINVIPPYMDLVTRKVRRVHIGTHGRAAHALMQSLFARAGWEIIFNYAPDSRHETENGAMELGDGIFMARNPAV